MSIVAHVENCYRYPIKGCRGIAGELTLDPERGVWRDRRFAIVSQSKTSERFPFGKAITQRQFPRLSTLKVEEISHDGYRLSYDDGVLRLGVVLSDYSERQRKEELFVIHNPDRPVVGEYIEDGELEYFFEKILGVAVRVYGVPYTNPRIHTSKSLNKNLYLGFADSHPVLIANLQSLAEINQKISEKDVDIVPVSRFRPNVVISSPLPWKEDEWRVIRIGDAVLENSEPCGRCQVVTIDQNTGLVSSNKEPFETLKKERMARGGPRFGSYYAIRKRGIIKPGAAVERLT